MKIWVDADSCPERVRNLICKTTQRLTIEAIFVANHAIPFPEHRFTKMVISEALPDAADNVIVENISQNDIAITRDIPLAARLVEKNITVINDRGVIFSTENIRERLSMRNFMLDMYKNGFMPEKTSTYSQKDFTNFANCFDRELQKKMRQNTNTLH